MLHSNHQTPTIAEQILTFLKNSDKFFLIPIAVSLFSAVFISEFFMYFYANLPAKLPLFYSLPKGQAQLVAKQQFFILPFVLILITLINIFIAYHLHEVQKILKKILLLNLILINLLILITAIKIITIFV